MAEQQTETRGYADPIRIVPLHQVAQQPAAPPSPHLTYRNGPLLPSVEVVTVFWGAAWEQSPHSAEVTRLNQFFDAILVSPLMDVLAEYSIPGTTIGHGTRTGSVTFTSSEPGPTVSDAAIQSLLQENAVSGGALPAPTSNTLYFVYLPQGTAVTMGNGSSCSTFCGYHDATSSGLFYAVMPYPDCTGCLGGMSIFDSLTVSSSHELCEAITDPIPGTGWYDDANGEIGDICAWQTATIGSFTVQREWSNAQNACVAGPG